MDYLERPHHRIRLSYVRVIIKAASIFSVARNRRVKIFTEPVNEGNQYIDMGGRVMSYFRGICSIVADKSNPHFFS